MKKMMSVMKPIDSLPQTYAEGFDQVWSIYSAIFSLFYDDVFQKLGEADYFHIALIDCIA